MQDMREWQFKDITVRALLHEEIDQALPLACAIRKDLSLSEWRQYCLANMRSEDGRSGVLAAVNDRGYILGLAFYEVKRDLARGRVVVADPFVAVSLYGRDRAAGALLEALSDIGLEHACLAVEVAVNERHRVVWPRECTPTFAKLRALGCELGMTRMCRPLSGDADRPVGQEGNSNPPSRGPDAGDNLDRD